MGFHRWNSAAASWKVLKPMARKLRREETPAEQLLWEKLRNRQLGYRFRRQAAIGRFIVDFVCPEARLVIEVDGPMHGDESAAKADAERDSWLSERGMLVFRVKNDEVENNMPEVLKRIHALVESREVSR